LIEKAINAEVDEIIQKMNMNEAIADDIMSYFTRLFEKIKAYYKTIDDSVNEFAEDLRIALQDEFSEFLGHMGIILNVKSLNEFIESENNTYGAIFQS
jgi:peptidoglycan hydrolase CwlO-like protein